MLASSSFSTRLSPRSFGMSSVSSRQMSCVSSTSRAPAAAPTADNSRSTASKLFATG
jgi:hypothetical protein